MNIRESTRWRYQDKDGKHHLYQYHDGAWVENTGYNLKEKNMIKLGSEVKDIVSGLKGKAVARCEWLQESAKPIILVEVTTEPSCMVWLDEDRLEELPPMT